LPMELASASTSIEISKYLDCAVQLSFSRTDNRQQASVLGR